EAEPLAAVSGGKQHGHQQDNTDADHHAEIVPRNGAPQSLGFVDRGSILMVVYLAFSEAVVEGLWRTVSWNDLGMMVGVSIVLLVAVLLATWYGSKWLGFNRADRITIMFCG